jgi:hypothetical protein
VLLLQLLLLNAKRAESTGCLKPKPAKISKSQVG